MAAQQLSMALVWLTNGASSVTPNLCRDQAQFSRYANYNEMTVHLEDNCAVACLSLECTVFWPLMNCLENTTRLRADNRRFTAVTSIA